MAYKHSITEVCGAFYRPDSQALLSCWRERRQSKISYRSTGWKQFASAANLTISAFGAVTPFRNALKLLCHFSGLLLQCLKRLPSKPHSYTVTFLYRPHHSSAKKYRSANSSPMPSKNRDTLPKTIPLSRSKILIG